MTRTATATTRARAAPSSRRTRRPRGAADGLFGWVTASSLPRKPSRLRLGARGQAASGQGSNVEVQRELVGVRPQADRIDLLLALVPDPRADHVAGEHVALQQELVVLLQVVQRL